MEKLELSRRRFLLTAHEGMASRLEALQKGAAKRARAAMVYFILVNIFFWFGSAGLWYILVVSSIKSNVLQLNMIFNESVGRRSSKLT